MSASLANFLFEAVNLLLLTAALAWFVWKPVRKALNAEAERHAAEAAASARLRAQADAALAEAEKQRAAAEAKLTEQRNTVLQQARAEAAQLLAEARRAEQAVRRKLDEQLASTRAAQALALSQTLGRIAADSVRQLLEALDGPALDLALTRAACAELAPLALAPHAAVLVESARPLDAEAKRLLSGVLAVEVCERVVPELGAGVRVTTPAGQVDATAVSLARRAARELTQSSAAVSGAEPLHA